MALGRGMSGPGAPLPPRQMGMTTPARRRPGSAIKAQMVTTTVFFIVGLSVLLSFDWTTSSFRPDALTAIFFGVLVSALIYIAYRVSAGTSSRAAANLRACPACHRTIPADALLCP